MDKVLISGISGSGKTTLAAAVSALLGLPQFELDALHHGPGWVKRQDFETDVDTFSAGSRWVTEDQYHTALGDLLWQRADTVIWLDLPRRTVMQRVIRRVGRPGGHAPRAGGTATGKAFVTGWIPGIRSGGPGHSTDPEGARSPAG